jgi:GAF domain-containing protein
MTRGVDAMEFARIAQALQAAPTPASTAEQIVAYVREQLVADDAGITVIRAGGRLGTVAATNSLVEHADTLQNELNEGPHRDSSWHGETLIVSDLASEERWPRWAAELAALGVCSLLAVELTTVEDERIGSINVYWTQPRTVSADDVAFVNIFARHAALALSSAMNKEGLNVALDTRKLIGQAQGLLMERYGLDEARAFEVLRRYSQEHNLKLRRVAEHLVSTRKLPTRLAIPEPPGAPGDGRGQVTGAGELSPTKE